MSEEERVLRPEELVQAIRALRLRVEKTLAPLNADPSDGEVEAVDTDELLAAITELQATFDRALTPDERAALPQAPANDTSAPFMYSTDHRQVAIEDFAFESAIQALELLAKQAAAVGEMKREKAYRSAIRVYYAMEDALRDDPDNATMREHMENMRRAHLSQFGKPVPPREE